MSQTGGCTECVFVRDEHDNRLFIEWSKRNQCIEITRVYNDKRLVLAISKPIDILTMRQLVAIPGMTVDAITAVLDMMEEHANIFDNIPMDVRVNKMLDDLSSEVDADKINAKLAPVMEQATNVVSTVIPKVQKILKRLAATKITIHQ